MFNLWTNKTLRQNSRRRVWPLLAALTSLVLVCGTSPLFSQDQSSSPSQSSTPPATDNGKPKQDVPDEAGGPTDNVGPYAIPKKKAEDAPPPPPVTPKKVEDMPDYSLKVNVPLVNVDVLVTTKDGQFVPGLKDRKSVV